MASSMRFRWLLFMLSLYLCALVTCGRIPLKYKHLSKSHIKHMRDQLKRLQDDLDEIEALQSKNSRTLHRDDGSATDTTQSSVSGAITGSIGLAIGTVSGAQGANGTIHSDGNYTDHFKDESEELVYQYSAVADLFPNYIVVRAEDTFRFTDLTEANRRHSICQGDACRLPVISQDTYDSAKLLSTAITADAAREQLLPSWPDDFRWSSNGPIAGMKCILIDEPMEHNSTKRENLAWENNHFCWSLKPGQTDPGIRWSHQGEISGMRCINIWIPDMSEAWDNNYLCAPNDTNYYFQWSHDGSIPGLDCMEWKEPNIYWHYSFLCMNSNPAPWPSWPEDYSWSHEGKITGMQCMKIVESEEKSDHSWRDNYLCWNKGNFRNPGIQWSEKGPLLHEKRCTNWDEPQAKASWFDNYLCSPWDLPYHFYWSPEGPIPGTHCLHINEPEDPEGWDDNYLCGGVRDDIGWNYNVSMLRFSLKAHRPQQTTSFKLMVSGLLSQMINASNEYDEWFYPMPPEKSFKILIYDEYDRSRLLIKDPERFNITVINKRSWKCGQNDALERCSDVSEGRLFWKGEYNIKVLTEEVPTTIAPSTTNPPSTGTTWRATTTKSTRTTAEGCITKYGSKCVFPFTFNGNSYSSCTSDGYHTLWCSTKNDVDGSYENWGECDQTKCHGESSYITSTTTKPTTADWTTMADPANEKSAKEKRRRRHFRFDPKHFPLNNATKNDPLHVMWKRYAPVHTEMDTCVSRGNLESDGTQTLCVECPARSTLPADVFPRYINEVLCSTTDNTCLLHQGSCVQSYAFVTFKKNTGGYSENEIHLWTDYQQMVRNGCHCQLLKGSAFDPFI